MTQATFLDTETMPSPGRLSRELRTHRGGDLARRRWLVSLSLLGAGAGGTVALYQMGVLPRLPDIPHRLFDATKVDKSDYAYKRLQTPDGALMAANYALTAILAAAGGQERVRQMPVVPLALMAKILYDIGVAVKLGTEEWSENKALCGYCQTATLASLASFGLALPETIAAVRQMRGTNDRQATPRRRRTTTARRTAKRKQTGTRARRAA